MVLSTNNRLSGEMSRNIALVLYGALLVVVVACIDLLFFRYQIERRLIANVAIVLLFAAVYVAFLRSHGTSVR